MKTTLHKQLGMLAETRHIQDPWGLGLTVEIRPLHYKPYQEWGRELMLSNPSTVKSLNQAVAAARGSKAKAQNLGPADWRRVFKDQAAGKEGVANHLIVSWTGFAVTEDGEDLDPEPYTPAIGIELLGDEEGWIPEYVNGHEDCREEVEAALAKPNNDAKRLKVRQRFEDEGVLNRHGGKLLGDALRDWILEEAGYTDKFREQVLEEASGN